MKLPELKLAPAPKWQKNRLKRWLAEWEINRQLPCPENPVPKKSPDSRSAPGTTASPLSAEPAPEIGQVRLFSPELPPAFNCLLFVALLQPVDQDSILTAPYSRFSEPCLPGELLTRRRTPCLRVLCAWNAVPMPISLLRKSWVANTLSDRELAEALAVLRNIRSGNALPDRLKKRVGPPYWHPADPRREYVAAETALMQAVLSGSESAGRRVVYPQENSGLLRAAEDSEPYGNEPGQTRDPPSLESPDEK